MAVVIVADSGSDLSPDETQRLGVEIVPVWIVIGDKKYRDGVDLDATRFYELTAKADVAPKTESPHEDQFAPVFARLTDAGHSVVAILLSSAFSQSVANATKAAAAYGDRVRIVDSLSSGGVESLLIERALELARSGSSAAEVADALKPSKTPTASFFTGPHVANLARSGRVAQAVASLSETLHVSVVLKINEAGSIVPSGQSRDEASAREIMVDSCVRALRGGAQRRFGISHARAPEAAAAVLELLRAREPSIGDVAIREYTPTIATHLGPGAVGINGIGV
jgi:DegV family protein with EDD domain